jgi:transcriptional regulator with XRE-family HTH domain
MAVQTATAGNLNPSISHSAALSNRVREILWHIPWYGFKTQARLAQDSGVSPAAISRLIRGESQPSLVVALLITQALSMRLGRPLDVSEVFSLDSTYPTASVCHLTGCRNCLPPDAYDEEEQIKLAYEGVKSGAWSLPSTTTENKPVNNGPVAKASETGKQKGGA